MNTNSECIPFFPSGYSAFDNYFLQAQRVRNLVRDDFDRVFKASNVLTRSMPKEQGGTKPSSSPEAVDVILHPSAIRTAPPLPSYAEQEPEPATDEGLDSYVQDVLTVPASLAGLPALNIPMGYVKDDGWPVGVSVVGQWGSEDLVMSIGSIIEEDV